MKGKDSRGTAKRSMKQNRAAVVLRAMSVALGLAFIACLLGACGQASSEAVVSGTVAYAEPVEPVPDMVVVVEIQEVSADGVTVEVIGQERIEDPGQVPVAFEVAYDPAEVDDSRTYIVHAHVEDGSGDLLYAATQKPAVISLGHPTEGVQVNLERIGGQAPASAGAGTAEVMHAEAVVSGTVAYAEPVEPVPGMVVIVEIQEVTADGTTVAVIGQERIEDPGPVPVAFQVLYDPLAVDDSRTYIVHARVEDGSGDLLYAAMQNPAVISQGHPVENVKVNLERIGGN